MFSCSLHPRLWRSQADSQFHIIYYPRFFTSDKRIIMLLSGPKNHQNPVVILSTRLRKRSWSPRMSEQRCLIVNSYFMPLLKCAIDFRNINDLFLSSLVTAMLSYRVVAATSGLHVCLAEYVQYPSIWLYLVVEKSLVCQSLVGTLWLACPRLHFVLTLEFSSHFLFIILLPNLLDYFRWSPSGSRLAPAKRRTMVGLYFKHLGKRPMIRLPLTSHG